MMDSKEIHAQIRSIQFVISKLLDAQNSMRTAAGGYHTSSELLAAKKEIEDASALLTGITMRIG